MHGKKFQFENVHFLVKVVNRFTILLEFVKYWIMRISTIIPVAHELTLRYPSVLALLVLIMATTSSTFAWLVIAGPRVAPATNAGRSSSMCWDFYTGEREREEGGRERDKYFLAKLVSNSNLIQSTA